MKNNLARRFSLLAFSVVISKLIGALYRIPLTNILGAEGIGLYQLVFPVFSLLLTLCSGGIQQSLSIAVSSRRARGEDTHSLLYCAMLAIGIFGTLLSVLLGALSKPLSILQSNERATVCYLVISPTIFLAGLIAVLRGYYMGKKNMLPTAVSQINEAGIKLGVGLLLAKLLLPRGIEYAVAGALLGITVSEIFTLVPFAFYARKEKGGLPVRSEIGAVMKELIAVAIPLTLSGIILPVSQFIDSILVVNILKREVGSSFATAQYGLFSGTVAPLVNVPVMLSISLGLAVIPSIAENKERAQLEGIRKRTVMCQKIAVFISIPFVIVYIILAGGILRGLYPALSSEETAIAVRLLQLQAANVLTLSVSQICTSVMQAVGKATRSVEILALCVLVKTGLSIVLLFTIGIDGAAIAGLVCFVLNALINFLYLAKLLGKSKTFAKNIAKFSVCGVIMVGVTVGLNALFAFKYAFAVIAVAAGLLYIVTVFVGGVFSKDELSCLPMAKLWLGMDKILRIKKKKNDNNGIIKTADGKENR